LTWPLTATRRPPSCCPCSAGTSRPAGCYRSSGARRGETIGPLDYVPNPDGAARGLFAADVIASELNRLAEQQRPDGGWEVDFASYSPAAALEWRGHATVRALSVLAGNGMLDS
jgi:hypothetical protein